MLLSARETGTCTVPSRPSFTSSISAPETWPSAPLGPRGVLRHDGRRIAVVQDGGELRAEDGVQRARLARHRALRRRDRLVDLGVEQT